MTRWCPACGRGGDQPPLPNAHACDACASHRITAMYARLDLWATTPRAGMAPDVTTATLHTGFLCIVETPEELAALRSEKPKAGPGPTTSGVPRTQQVLRPIDRVAARVVPDPA